MPPAWELARRAEEHLKGLIVPGTLFEEFGFNYIGPIDGHHLPTLVETLRNIKKLGGPQFLHVITRKGKGYAPAEEDPVKYHAVTPFDPDKGMVSGGRKPARPKYQDIFSDWVCDMAARDRRLVAITPAMREGSGLVRFEKEFPERYFDVAIAEQHSVCVAAGMACDGLKPVVAIYSTFLQRGYDQLVHDVVVQNLPVLFAIDRAGLVGGDGPTHNGCYDLSYLRCLPGIVIMAPADENECRQMLYTGFMLDRPAAVRYPRGTGPGVEVQQEMTALPVGKGVVVRRGRGIAILAFGAMVTPCLAVGDELDATVVNMRFVKPMDEQLILEMAQGHDWLFTVEENSVLGGAGSGVNEVLASHGTGRSAYIHGIPDRLIQHGEREDMLEDAGLTVAGISAFVRRHVQQAARPGGVKRASQ
jgi:1-deoxy-D-xylulose-5-phosphate synthase